MATADLPKDSKPHRPVVPGNTALGKTCSTRPAESLVSLAVRLWLANALVCLSLYVRRRLSDCLLCRWLTLLLWRLPRKSVGANIVRPSIFFKKFSQELLFFFSLLKRKKEAKKEKLSPTLIPIGSVSHDWQCFHSCISKTDSPSDTVHPSAGYTRSRSHPHPDT